MSKQLALQQALRAALLASDDLLLLVPAAHILDTHMRPPPSPSIILGEDVTAPSDGNVNRDRAEVWHDMHVWVAELSTVRAKQIMGAVREALRLDGEGLFDWQWRRPDLGQYQLVDWHISRERVMRDPGGEMSHGVMTLRAVIGGLG